LDLQFRRSQLTRPSIGVIWRKKKRKKRRRRMRRRKRRNSLTKRSWRMVLNLLIAFQGIGLNSLLLDVY
jgi:hypothetical protein